MVGYICPAACGRKGNGSSGGFLTGFSQFPIPVRQSPIKPKWGSPFSSIPKPPEDCAATGMRQAEPKFRRQVLLARDNLSTSSSHTGGLRTEYRRMCAGSRQWLWGFGLSLPCCMGQIGGSVVLASAPSVCYILSCCMRPEGPWQQHRCCFTDISFSCPRPKYLP